MQYRLLKQFDKDSIPVGDTFDMGDRKYAVLDFDDSKISLKWLIKEGYIEPIREKKRYEDLKKGEICFFIDGEGLVRETCFVSDYPRSQTFLTREEAEDEHKRREWAVRPDKFIPKEGEMYWTQWRMDVEEFKYTNEYIDNLIVNAGLAFRTEEDCEKAIKEHDLIRLFYTIR